MVTELLARLAKEFPVQVQQPFKGNYLQRFVADEIPLYFREVFNIGLSYLDWRASVGLGNWSEIPWIAALDTRITSTTQDGFYVVLLFSVDCEDLYLGMQLGTENLRNEHGVHQSRLIMTDRNAEITSFVDSTFPNHPFQNLTPNLLGKNRRTKSYEDAFSIGKHYRICEFPDEVGLKSDIIALLQIYQALVAAHLNGDILQNQEDITIAENPTLALLVTEKAQYKIHKSYERNSRAARDAKRLHGYICQVCGFDFEAVYGERGRQYIEAHHLYPLSDLKPGQEMQYSLETDFAVLCSNCHSMVHRHDPPISITELKRLMELVQTNSM